MKKIVFITALLVLLSCDGNKIYKQVDRDFDNNRWLKSDVRKFEFEITNAVQSYDLVMHFSHVAGFQFDLIPIQISMQGPEQPQHQEQFLLRIKDTGGNDRGDCLGDYCDLEQTLFEKQNLAAGKYEISLKNNFPREYLPNVLGVGIEVRKSEAE